MKLELSFKFSTTDVLDFTHLAAWHESVWTWMSGEPFSPAESYLGGSVGVHQNHVLCALFDLELDVILSFQGSQAAAAGAHSRLTVGGVWGQRAFWVKTKKKEKRKLSSNGTLEKKTDIHDSVCITGVFHKYTPTINSKGMLFLFWLQAILKLAKQTYWTITLLTKTHHLATSVVT